MQKFNRIQLTNGDRVKTTKCSGQKSAVSPIARNEDSDYRGERINNGFTVSNDSDHYVSDDGLDDHIDSGVTSLGVSYTDFHDSELTDYSSDFIIGCNSSSNLSEVSDRDEPIAGSERDPEQIMLLPLASSRDAEASSSEAVKSSLTEECQRVEQWLDSHPDFVLDYFTRKQPRLKGVCLESPLTSPLYGGLGAAALGGFDPVTSGSGSTSRASSGANTPVRKISAQEFERNGQLLARMVQTVDGIPSFLSATSEPRSEACSGGLPVSSSTSLKPRRSFSELKALDEHQLMHELIRDICDDLDVTRLCHKILKNVGFLLGADRCSLFLVQQSGECSGSTSQCGHHSQSTGHNGRRRESTGQNNRESTGSIGSMGRCWSMGRESISYCSETECHDELQGNSESVNSTDHSCQCRESTSHSRSQGHSGSTGQFSQCSRSDDFSGNCSGSAGRYRHCRESVRESMRESTSHNELHTESINHNGQCSRSTIYNGQCQHRRSRQYESTDPYQPDEHTSDQCPETGLNHYSGLCNKTGPQHTIDQRNDIGHLNDRYNNTGHGMGQCYETGQEHTFDQCERYLVSTLFDVGVGTSLQEGTRMSQEIRIPMGTGIVGHVALTGEGLNIPEAYEDKRFNKDVDRLTGYKTRSILCMPLLDSNGQVIAVAQAINKKSVKDEPFSEQDEKVFKSYLAFCGIGIHNAQMYERSTLENRRNQLMLDLAWVIFEEQSNVATLINKILLHTVSLLRCERCQLVLVDTANPSKFSQAFDIQASDFDNDNSYYREGNHEARFPVNTGIVGYVAATGKTLNISDAYQDERFNPAVEADTEFRSRTILCMPIKNVQGQVIGVVQLTNKLDDTAFNRNDEHLFEAFAIFCGMGINNTRMYEQVVKAMAKQRVAMEVLSYHSTATTEEVQRFKKCLVSSPPMITLNLSDYKFNDAHLDDDGTLKAVCRMFQHLNLIEQFSMPYDVFLRWLLTVKKNYRAVAYHNWRHAFNVTQTMYAMALSGCMKNVLSDLEILALLVGCLSHDLDHRGTNNQFQIKTMSALAELYSTSIMEWHHYEHCIRILTTKGTEILCNLSEEQNKNVVSLLREAILATDLSLYFKHRDDFFVLVESNSAAWSQPSNRPLLRSMMMTACDLAAITKPWLVQQKVAYLLADEFFEQGDIEKSQLHMKPIEMMDRDNTPRLPAMQLVFIDTICMPVYEAFAQLSDDYRTLLIGCRKNRERWAELAEGASDKLECEEEQRENEYKDQVDDDVHSTEV